MVQRRKWKDLLVSVHSYRVATVNSLAGPSRIFYFFTYLFLKKNTDGVTLFVLFLSLLAFFPLSVLRTFFSHIDLPQFF